MSQRLSAFGIVLWNLIREEMRTDRKYGCTASAEMVRDGQGRLYGASDRGGLPIHFLAFAEWLANHQNLSEPIFTKKPSRVIMFNTPANLNS